MKVERIDRSLVHGDFRSGIYPFRLNVSIYVADGVLIDAGSSGVLGQIRSFLKDEQLNCAALTHVHEDHTGAAAWLKENLGIPVYLHRSSIEEASEKSSVPLYRWLCWGNRKGFAADPMPEVIETELYRFDVIDAPGHHPYHVVFHEKNMGWLFTGDLYVSRKQQVAFKDENISDSINTIEKILKLDFDTVFCGHSGVQKHGKQKFSDKLDYFMGIRGRVEELRKQGLGNKEIDKRLFPEKNMWTLISGGEWSTLNMVKTV